VKVRSGMLEQGVDRDAKPTRCAVILDTSAQSGADDTCLLSDNLWLLLT
jgi:hypothetical protein